MLGVVPPILPLFPVLILDNDYKCGAKPKENRRHHWIFLSKHYKLAGWDERAPELKALSICARWWVRGAHKGDTGSGCGGIMHYRLYRLHIPFLPPHLPPSLNNTWPDSRSGYSGAKLLTYDGRWVVTESQAGYFAREGA